MYLYGRTGVVMGKVLKGLLLISSYIPVFIMIFLKSLSSFTLKDIKKHGKVMSVYG